MIPIECIPREKREVVCYVTRRPDSRGLAKMILYRWRDGQIKIETRNSTIKKMRSRFAGTGQSFRCVRGWLQKTVKVA